MQQETEAANNCLSDMTMYICFFLMCFCGCFWVFKYATGDQNIDVYMCSCVFVCVRVCRCVRVCVGVCNRRQGQLIPIYIYVFLCVEICVCGGLRLCVCVFGCLCVLVCACVCLCVLVCATRERSSYYVLMRELYICVCGSENATGDGCS